MGVSAVGFIATDRKDVWPISIAVEKAIQKGIRESINDGDVKGVMLFSLCAINVEAMPLGRMMSFSFRDSSDQRNLYLHFDCDCDYSDTFKGKKIIFSLGAWGNCDKWILAVGNALLAEIGGRFFWTPNDCSGKWNEVVFGKSERTASKVPS